MARASAVADGGANVDARATATNGIFVQLASMRDAVDSRRHSRPMPLRRLARDS